VRFEARKEILHFMAMPVDAPVNGGGVIVEFEEALAWYGAAGGTMLAQCLAEAQAVKALSRRASSRLRVVLLNMAAS
jgi:hypothetical protein